VFFLGYSTLHKAYKCLDVATGRVYVSRDVFDEKVFQLATMHKNVGAHLKSDISCLHPTLLNHRYGDPQVVDQYANFPAESANDLVENAAQVEHAVQQESENNTEEDAPENLRSGVSGVPGGVEMQSTPNSGPAEARPQQTAT
jgi:hypothetical protein